MIIRELTFCNFHTLKYWSIIQKLIVGLVEMMLEREDKYVRSTSYAPLLFEIICREQWFVKSEHLLILMSNVHIIPILFNYILLSLFQE